MQEYIHNYESQYTSFKKKLEESNMFLENKNLIKAFDRDCTLKERLALPTILKYYDVLITIAEKYTGKSFKKLAKSDFESHQYKLRPLLQYPKNYLGKQEKFEKLLYQKDYK